MLVARYHLGPLEDPVADAVHGLVEADAVARLWRRDHTLFADDPDECANRMGWLDAPGASERAWGQLRRDAAAIAETCDQVLVMGMGGSSLFPEVLAATFGPAAGHPRLRVIDTTHPAAVRRIAEACPPERTFHLAASKSGSTVETRSHLAWFWERSGDPRRFGVITDPGSALGALARERGFAHVWENDPDIGGRFSALSLFGMVPAALAGVDGEAMLDAASEAIDVLAPLGDEAALHLGLRLGAILGAAARTGRNRLTLLLDPRVESFAAWLEQLVAESLGKGGVGVVPIVGEAPEVIAATADRRVLVGIGDVELPRLDGVPAVHLDLEEPVDLGAQVVAWEFATAIAGRVIDRNPFDQPDVEAAKVAARAVLAGDGGVVIRPTVELDLALAAVRPDDVVAVCAFVDPDGSDATRLEAARLALGRRLGVATTFGYGPRFLHSTGQLHKGGDDDLVVIQVLDRGDDDLAIPGERFGFGALLAAQADGDLDALAAAGRRAFRVDVSELAALGEGPA